MSNGLLADDIWTLTVVTVFVVLAVLPTFIALVRGADEILLIMLVNALCCATVIGWPIALVMAIKWPRKHRHPTPSPHVRSSPPRTQPQHPRRVIRGRIE
ncbi:superinfection immunity protein [Spirillospora sp. NPDC000708]|uniref:superinfection immunity protein n=1 Tax=Actinomadura nitritigenes TaxID=134602 RepID=UPI00335441DC